MFSGKGSMLCFLVGFRNYVRPGIAILIMRFWVYCGVYHSISIVCNCDIRDPKERCCKLFKGLS